MGALVAFAMAALIGPLTGVSPSHDASQCLRAITSIPADSVARSEAFVRVACPSGRIANPFRYDAAQSATHLVHPLSVGDVVHAFPEFGIAAVHPGDNLELVGMSGAVRIERDVEALQAAQPGGRLFVRGNDGRIFSVRYEDIAQ